MPTDNAHRFLFYAPELEPRSGSITLSGDEHHHLHRVLRLRAGESVYATNGRGLIVGCRIASVGPDASELVRINTVTDDGPSRRVTLALACLRQNAFAQAVEQCTQLGMTECLPFVSSRCRVKTYSPSFLKRLGSIALSAMKQSFRPVLPAIAAPVSFEALLALLEPPVVVADADGRPLASHVNGPITLIVGPEAGLAAEETARLRAVGCAYQRVSRYRLRSETAAAAALAVVLSADGDARSGGD